MIQDLFDIISVAYVGIYIQSFGLQPFL
jgi:hypothetical protein